MVCTKQYINPSLQTQALGKIGIISEKGTNVKLSVYIKASTDSSNITCNVMRIVETPHERKCELPDPLGHIEYRMQSYSAAALLKLISASG